jgi:hypothetical protein
MEAYPGKVANALINNVRLLPGTTDTQAIITAIQNGYENKELVPKCEYAEKSARGARPNDAAYRARSAFHLKPARVIRIREKLLRAGTLSS